MQVLQTLNLPKVRICSGMHDARHYDLGFVFRTNRYMTLTFNMLTKPPTFLEAHLYGDGWPVKSSSGNEGF